MPLYFFWGEDDYMMGKAVDQLRKKVLDPNWSQFNYTKIPEDGSQTTVEGLNQAMTPAFGVGGRLVWVADTNLGQHCSETLLAELERTLPQIPNNSHLLLTSAKKPDGRAKATKLLKKYGEIRSFPTIPPWKTEEILDRVKQSCGEYGVKLTPEAKEFLAEAVGNNTRLLEQELDKLRLYGESQPQALALNIVSNLVTSHTQSSLELANAIRKGHQTLALKLVSELINRNEPPLRIIATLTKQFRTWLIIKLMLEKGERDEKVIATVAEIPNPKRIYFLRQEVSHLSGKKLLATLPALLELEVNLKKGAIPLPTLQTQVIKLCQICK
ncbi:MAG: DNA polymerase III subunit delta [Spirulinaceae cyanobacterium]